MCVPPLSPPPRYFPTAKDPEGKTGCEFPYCVYYIGTTSLLNWALDLKVRDTSTRVSTKVEY